MATKITGDRKPPMKAVPRQGTKEPLPPVGTPPSNRHFMAGRQHLTNSETTTVDRDHLPQQRARSPNRILLLEKTTKSLLASALSTQDQIDQAWQKNKDFINSEKKEREMLKDHIKSITHVVKILGSELDQVEDRSRTTTLALQQQLQKIEHTQMANAGTESLSRHQQEFLNRSVQTAVQTLTSDQRQFQQRVSDQLTSFQDKIYSLTAKIDKLSTAVSIGANQSEQHRADDTNATRELAGRVDSLFSRIEDLGDRIQHVRSEQQERFHTMNEEQRQSMEVLLVRAEELYREKAAESASAETEQLKALMGGASGDNIMPILNARLAQLAAELRALLAEDRSYHTEERKRLSDRLTKQINHIAVQMNESQSKLSETLGRMMTASEKHLKQTTDHLKKRITSEIQKEKVEARTIIQQNANSQQQILKDKEDGLHLSIREIQSQVDNTAAGLELVSSLLHSKSELLEAKISKILKTVVVV